MASSSSSATATPIVSQHFDNRLESMLVLASVRVVCREYASVAALQHVATSIDAFLCPSLRAYKTFEDAVAVNNMYLLYRLLVEETAAIESIDDEQKRQQRQYFVGLQVTKAARHAVQQRSPNLRCVLECLRTFDSHAVGASEVIAEAAAAHDLELLEWLRTACPPLDLDLIDSSAAAARVAGNGDIDVLEWLVANRWSPLSKVPVADAVVNRQMSVLRWLETNNTAVQVSIDADVVYKAAALGDLEMFAWLFARQRGESVKRASDGAASGGHVHVLEWLLVHRPDDAPCSQRGYSKAARNGHVSVLQWLYAHYPQQFWEDAVHDAASAGQPAVLRFLFEHRDVSGSTDGLMFEAASSGSIDAVKVVYEFLDQGTVDTRTRLTYSAIQGAARSGNLELVEWLHEAYDAPVDTIIAINLAIAYGHLDVAKYIVPFQTNLPVSTIETAARANRMDILTWLHATFSEPKSSLLLQGEGTDQAPFNPRDIVYHGMPLLPINDAACNGNLAMIEWLDAHGYVECSSRAMNGAAAGGYLDVVKWLHEHRTEGCTTDAMNYAAANGHFNVVRWLHEHRSEGGSSYAIDYAVRNGHPRVVDFLLQHRSNDGCTDAAVRDAVEVRHDAELIHLLFTHRPDMVSIARVRAHAVGHEAMQRWLRHVGEKS